MVAKLAKYQASKNQIFRKYEENATRKKIPFHLTQEQLNSVAEKDCTFCEAPATASPAHVKYYGAWKSNGLDRKDNTKGYTIENVQPCCFMCNRMKSNLKEEDFLEHVGKIKCLHKER